MKMAGFLRSRKILICGLFSILTDVNEIDLEKFKEARGLYITDPWLRVKSIFSKDDFGNLHPELVYAIRATQFGALGGGIFGGMIESMRGVENFVRTNDTKVYSNKRELYKELNKVHVVSLLKGAYRWAPRCAIFCGSFTLIASCCEIYRNKPLIIDNTIAGTLVGALLKFSFGIKGIISGGIIGGMLGTVYGIAQWGLMKLSKTDHLQMKYVNFAYMQYKKEKKVEFNKPHKNAFDKDSYFRHSQILDPLSAITTEEVSEEKKDKDERDIE